MIIFTSGLLLVVAACLEFCTCYRSPLAYLPIKDKCINGRAINWVVEQIDSGRWGNNIQALPASLEDAAQAALNMSLGKPFDDRTGVTEFKTNKDRFNWLYETIWDLGRLSDEEVGVSKYCTELDVRIMIDIMESKFGGAKKLKPKGYSETAPKSLALGYMRHFAPKFLSRCLSNLDEQIRRSLIKMDDTDVEAKMDALVSMGAELSPEEADVRLTLQAENLDLAKGKFDAQRMLMAIRHYIGKEVAKPSWFQLESAKLLINFLEKTCSNLRRWLASPLDVYNMARLLVPDKSAQLKLTSEFRKLNEYSRICLPLTRTSKREVRANIKANFIRIGIQIALG